MHKFISILLCFFIIFQSVHANDTDTIAEELAAIDDSTKTMPHTIDISNTPPLASSQWRSQVLTVGILLGIIACVTSGVILLNGDSKSLSDKPSSRTNETTSPQSSGFPNDPSYPNEALGMSELLALLNISAS
jgi:hypothetical protein